MTLSSIAVDVVIVGGMLIGLYFTDPQDLNQMTIGQGLVICLAIAAGCWFPMWVPYKVEDYIDSL